MAVPVARNIREALALALEALPGDPFEWAVIDRKSLRAHATDWIKKYGAARDVVYEDKDVADEIDAVIKMLRSGVKPSSKPSEELP